MFTMTAINLINALLIALGLGVCILCFMQTTFSMHINKLVKRYFQLLFIMIISYISAHLARQLMEGMAGSFLHIALYAITFIEISVAGFMTYMISMLILVAVTKEKSVKIIEKLFFVFFIAHELLLIVGLPFDLVFLFNANNEYSRGSGYFLSSIIPVIMLIIDMELLIHYRKNIDRAIKSAFWLYMISPLVAILLQSIFFGLQFIIFATVISAVYMFGVIIREQNETFQKQNAEKSRIESELSLATRIQTDMLPNTYPAFPDRSEFDIYASMTPAREVGGDFYDYFLIDKDHLCMLIADVSGKGIPAALFMMASRIIIASNAKSGKSPAEILESTNEAICQHNREEMFVTVWLGILEISTGKLTAANAGHEFPILKSANGDYELIKDKHGFIVGGMAGMKYKEYEMQLHAGSKLFLYTDGIPEATSGTQEMFGIKRLLNVLNENRDVSPEFVLKNVKKAVDVFVQDAEQFDDLTMLCMEYKG